MEELVDRAALIEAASRSLRQQMARGAVARDRPRSKGSLHGGVRGGSCNPSSGDPLLVGGGAGGEPRGGGEHAQRRIRSAENQHRLLSDAREEPSFARHVAPTLSAAALERRLPDASEDADLALDSSSRPSGAAADLAGPLGGPPVAATAVPEDFRRERKRPLSRKNQASAAAGLGAFSGPSRMSEAFEQRKTRQPIPVESWGPRPPSRSSQKPGLDGSLDDGRPNSRAGATNDQALTSGAGGTWAAARSESRVHSEGSRRGRERRSRGSPTELDLKLSDSGAALGAKLSRSLSGALEHPGQQRRTPQCSLRPTSHSEVSIEPLEVNGLGLTSAALWPDSPAAQSCGSSPGWSKARHCLLEAVSVTDVEPDLDLDLGPLGAYRRDATPPQVIVTRSQVGRYRGDRRHPELRAARDRGRGMPFTTSLDVDFLSLFAA